VGWGRTQTRPGARWLVPPAPGTPPARASVPAQRTMPPAPPAPRTEPADDDIAWGRALTLGLAAGLLTMVAGMVFWSAAPRLAGWRSQVVLTGSMQPRIHPGDLVLAAPAARGQLKPGRIVLFQDPVRPGRTIVHRLVRYDDNGNLVTKGDANPSEDSTPVAPSAVLGMPRLRVPYIGRPVVWIHEKDTGSLLLASAVLCLGAAGLGWPLVVEPTPASPRHAPRDGRRRAGHRR
jgi:signal peptidase